MYFLFLEVRNIMAGAAAPTLDGAVTFGMEANRGRSRKTGL